MGRSRSGFTLIELMVVIAIIAVLVTIGVTRYAAMANKSKESTTRGNLAALRSALSIYYSDNENSFPVDNLSSLTFGGKYIPIIPIARTPGFHGDSALVQDQIGFSDVGGWHYNNSYGVTGWGTVQVSCSHADSQGRPWSSY